MKRVTGIGGVFFKSDNPKEMREWYQRHLGIDDKGQGYVCFEWRDKDEPEKSGMTLLTLFKRESNYFEPSKSQFMINYRVEDLDGLLAALKEEGVEVVDRSPDESFGKFAWIVDPEGNKIELWEPPAE